MPLEGREPPAVALNRLDIENCLVQLVSQTSLVERSAENRVLWTAPWTVPWTVPFSLLDLQSLGAPHYVAMSLTRQAKNVFEDRCANFNTQFRFDVGLGLLPPAALLHLFASR